MNGSLKKDKRNPQRITDIGLTQDSLTSRAGLSLFVRYLSGIHLYTELSNRFGRIRKSSKGQEVTEIFKQILCFLFDGTSRHLTYFDHLKKDEGYAKGIESGVDDLVSSHGIKRFFYAFSWPLIWIFRTVLRQLFLWRLNIVHPDVIIIDVDSMVMDNDTAQKRHGVQPTYKKKKGFHPIQMTWSRFIVDAVFQGGKKHCNHGDSVARMIKHVVADIRIHYRWNVPIIFSFDSGYFDQKLLSLCEALKVGYVCGGKLYKDVKHYLSSVDESCFRRYDKVGQTWDYFEFGDKAGSWTKYRRAIFCRPRYEDRQSLLEFARPDSLIYTNLGMGQPIDDQLRAVGKEEYIKAEGGIALYHGRGRNELVNRSFKDFGFEELPFKRFAPNAALYYVMLLGFFLFESFKEDVLSGELPLACYATTLRRRLVDLAGKIVRTGGKTILKFSKAAWASLDLRALWERSGCPPKIVWDPCF